MTKESPTMQNVKQVRLKVNSRLKTCDFVCGTMSRAKSSLHWSVIHYQMNFE